MFVKRVSVAAVRRSMISLQKLHLER